jgi:hypothetical protein
VLLVRAASLLSGAVMVAGCGTTFETSPSAAAAAPQASGPASGPASGTGGSPDPAGGTGGSPDPASGGAAGAGPGAGGTTSGSGATGGGGDRCAIPAGQILLNGGVESGVGKGLKEGWEGAIAGIVADPVRSGTKALRACHPGGVFSVYLDVFGYTADKVPEEKFAAGACVHADATAPSPSSVFIGLRERVTATDFTDHDGTPVTLSSSGWHAVETTTPTVSAATNILVLHVWGTGAKGDCFVVDDAWVVALP